MALSLGYFGTGMRHVVENVVNEDVEETTRERTPLT
jgi:hypothetical protein